MPPRARREEEEGSVVFLRESFFEEDDDDERERERERTSVDETSNGEKLERKSVAATPRTRETSVRRRGSIRVVALHAPGAARGTEKERKRVKTDLLEEEPSERRWESDESNPSSVFFLS